MPNKSYPRLLADAAFHAKCQRLALERARAVAPESDHAELDQAITDVEAQRRWHARQAEEAQERRRTAAA